MTQAATRPDIDAAANKGGGIIELENIPQVFPYHQGRYHASGHGSGESGGRRFPSASERERRTVWLASPVAEKTTTARMVLQVETPTDGVMKFNGKDTRQFTNADRREYRASVQAVFQDPWSSLNPRMRVGSIIMEPLLTNHPMGKHEAQEQLETLLRDVGLRQAPGRLLPARIQRRTAPTDRHCPGAISAPQAHRAG